MRKSEFPEEQIAFALRQVESGTPDDEILPEAEAVGAGSSLDKHR